MIRPLLIVTFCLATVLMMDPSSAEEWSIYDKRPHPYTDVDDMIKYFDRGLDFTTEVNDHEFSNLFLRPESRVNRPYLSREDAIAALEVERSPSLSDRRPVQKGSPARNQQVLKSIKEAGAVWWFELPGSVPECREMTAEEKANYQRRAQQADQYTQSQGDGNVSRMTLRKPEKYQFVSIDVGVSAFRTLIEVLSNEHRKICFSQKRVWSHYKPTILDRIVIQSGLFEYECVLEQAQMDPVSRKRSHGRITKNPFWKMACLTKQGDLGGY